MMRHRLWKTSLLVAVLLLAGLVTPGAGGQDSAAGAQGDPVGGRALPEPPPNDDFADAIPFTGMGASRSRITDAADVQRCDQGQPWRAVRRFLGLPVYPAGGYTIWWRWTPNRTGWVTVDTGLSQGRPLDTVLGVYQGRNCDEGQPFYRRLIKWDDDSGRNYMSRIRFRAYSGAQYYFVVDGGDMGGRTCTVVTYPAYYITCGTTSTGSVVVRVRAA